MRRAKIVKRQRLPWQFKIKQDYCSVVFLKDNGRKRFCFVILCMMWYKFAPPLQNQTAATVPWSSFPEPPASVIRWWLGCYIWCTQEAAPLRRILVIEKLSLSRWRMETTKPSCRCRVKALSACWCRACSGVGEWTAVMQWSTASAADAGKRPTIHTHSASCWVVNNTSSAVFEQRSSSRWNRRQRVRYWRCRCCCRCWWWLTSTRHPLPTSIGG